MLCFVERRDLEKGPEEMPQDGGLGGGGGWSLDRVWRLAGGLLHVLQAGKQFSFLPSPD